MIEASIFRAKILDPIIEDFYEHPNSLRYGTCVIWALDAYASHLAFAGRDLEALSSRQRAKVESEFKGSLETSGSDFSWVFRLVREAANATKHAVRISNTSDIPYSSRVETQQVDGAFAYFSQARH